MITVTLNGKPAQLDAPMTVQQFLEARHKTHPRFVVVELCGHPIGRAEFPLTVINEGDVIEVVAPFGGG